MAADAAGHEDAACCSLCNCPRWGRRSVKRKVGEMEGEAAARVVAEDEVAALREAVESHREMVAQLSAELEEERAAASSAADEAMGMILRLQRQKGEVQMEARQFRLFADEKMAHDQEELLALEELLYEREHAIVELSGEVQLYRDRLLSCGIALDSLESVAGIEGGDRDALTSPVSARSPSRGSLVDEMEKGVVMGQLAQLPPGDAIGSGEEQEEFGFSHGGGDDDSTSDRVYTVDAVHSEVTLGGGIGEVCGITSKEPVCGMEGPCEEEEVDIRKLDLRLQALEADREMMRRAIVSMQEDKAQLVLLKEIAQHLCKDVSVSAHSVPLAERKLVRKPFLVWCFAVMSVIKATIRTSFLGRFSFMSTIKWILSFVFWKKKTDQRNSRYTLGLSHNNVGLLLLLDNAPRIRQLRCHSKIRARSV